MLNGHDWMIEDHSRSAVSHHNTNLLSHIRPVTMDLTIGTERLIFHKWTSVTLSAGIFHQFSAIVTQSIFRMMFSTI